MTITPTLARGLRRRSTRVLNDRSDDHFGRSIRELQGAQLRHGPWYRRVLNMIENDPAGVILQASKSGTGKHVKWAGIVLSYNGTAWATYFIRVVVRDRSIARRYAGVTVSHHAIERAMQWWKMDNAITAIKFISAGVYVGCLRQMGFRDDVLENLNTGTVRDEWLLGFPGGALTAVPDREDPEDRIITTALRDRDRWKGYPVPKVKIRVLDNEFTREAFRL